MTDSTTDDKINDLMDAITGLWQYMDEKYPGEPLKCPHMIAIRKAYDALNGPQD